MHSATIFCSDAAMMLEWPLDEKQTVTTFLTVPLRLLVAFLICLPVSNFLI